MSAEGWACAITGVAGSTLVCVAVSGVCVMLAFECCRDCAACLDLQWQSLQTFAHVDVMVLVGCHTDGHPEPWPCSEAWTVSYMYVDPHCTLPSGL